MGQWASDGSYIDHNVQLKDSNLSGSDAILPTDIQSHLQTTIQTHNAVSVGATNGTSASSWIDTDGFDKIVINIKNDAATNSYAYIDWSPDNGTTIGGQDGGILNNTTQTKSSVIDTKLRYARVTLVNTDAAAHTMSAWAMLKA